MVRRCAVIVVFVVATASPEAAAQPPNRDGRADLLKAAFLYSFAVFAEWPGDAGTTPLKICTFDAPAVADSLETLATGRVVKGRPVAVVRLATLPAERGCHVLFVAGGDPAGMATAITAAARPGLLTIGEGERFVRMGGIGGLFLENDRMRFAVNTDALQRAGLRLSSSLLSLARIVRDGPP